MAFNTKPFWQQPTPLLLLTKENHPDLIVKNILDQGMFGVVYAGTLQQKPVAIKAISVPRADRGAAELIPEVHIMKGLQHPNLMNLHQVIDQADSYYIVMDKMERSLRDFLRADGLDRLSIEKFCHLGKQLVSGLAYLHAQEIIHCDLKSSNVLLNTEGQLKIADFGLATSSNPNRHKTAVGTVNYMAPELFSVGNQRNTPESDIYALAILLWEFISKDEPFKNIRFRGQFQVVFQNNPHTRPPIPAETPKGLSMLIESAWHTEPQQRGSLNLLSEKLNPEWITAQAAPPSPLTPPATPISATAHSSARKQAIELAYKNYYTLAAQVEPIQNNLDRIIRAIKKSADIAKRAAERATRLAKQPPIFLHSASKSRKDPLHEARAWAAFTQGIARDVQLAMEPKIKIYYAALKTAKAAAEQALDDCCNKALDN